MNSIVLPNLNQSLNKFGIDMTFIVLTANGGTDQKLLINKSKMGINSLIPAFAGNHLDNFY